MSLRHSVRTGLVGVLLAPLLLVPATPAAAQATDCGGPLTLHRNDFPAVPKVDHKFFPLVPGTKWVLKGTVDGAAHTVVTTVTDLTKVIDGVPSMVLLDEDFGPHHAIQEAELAFMAQDKQGAVWNLGEYPEEYENGVFTGAPNVWISGLAKAHAGIGMLANPTVGTPAYLQGLAPAIEFKDCAQVFQTGQHTCVTTGCYDDVLVTDEFGPLDPAGGHHRKFYAPGVGVVRVDAIGDTHPEILQLTRFRHLCPAGVTRARDRALALDAHGRQVSPDVYGRTPAAHQTLQAPPC
ncbi:hypothetical protein [Actinocrispum wychmicini]|uniref:Uncharacterized protein n=1 Tax=Actinocrispum wychmicini TaxID=1213861 RepID=A0A4R2JDF8_9PSEU|nr:hypothetical protein [Actinocrispum wychmicini]TCO54219.1 hypothetical protein EV192_109199 [Actinocrispum wychmicini]